MKTIFAVIVFFFAGFPALPNDPASCATPDECKAACEKMDAESCDRLAGWLQTGYKTDKNPEKSVKYKVLSCEYDDAYRCLVAGWDYQYPYSDKIKSDLNLAELFYQKACDKGDKRGCEFILAMKEGRAAKPGKNETRPSEPKMLCSEPKLTAIKPGSDPPHKYILDDNQIDEPAKLLKRVEPTYPEAERQNGKTGKVMLEIVVGEHGEVAHGRVLKAESLLFEQAAEAAVKQWQYSPPRHCGKAVSVYKMVMVSFTLH